MCKKMKYLSTHCCSPIDSRPLTILKQVTNPIAILLKSIIHHSLTTRSVPDDKKLAPFFCKNLGVQLDSVHSMDYQISNMHNSIHYHLNSLRSILNSIPLSIAIIISSSYYLSLTTAIIYSLISPHIN